MTRTAPLAGLLLRGELRVQGLIGKHPLLTAGEGVLAVGVLVLLAAKVRHLLLTGMPSATNAALLTAGLSAVLVLNVLVLGTETRTRVPDLLSWAAPLPLLRSEVRRLLMLSGLLRALLFSAVLVAGVVVGALSCTREPWRWLQVLGCAVVLPTLPVVIGLRLGAHRSDPVPQAALAIPLGVVLFAAAVALPTPGGAVGRVVQVLALPALTLLGTAPAGPTLALLVVWLGLVVGVVRGLRLDTISPQTRPARAGVLARASRRDPYLAVVDVVNHRVRRWHFLQAAGFGLVPGLAVLLVARGTSAPVELVALLAAGLAFPAVAAGYAHLVPATTTAAPAQAWVTTTPLSPGSLRTVAHLTRTAAAACAAATVAALSAVVLAGLGRADLGWPIAAAALLSAGSLGGWVAGALAATGLHRARRYYLLLGIAGVRALIVTAVTLTAPLALAIVLIVVLDLIIGGVGQCLLYSTSPRPPSTLRSHFPDAGC